MSHNSRKSRLFSELRVQERQRNKIFIAAACVLVVIGIGWIIFSSLSNKTPSNVSHPDISSQDVSLQDISLQEKWEILENRAHSWKSDSYLIYVTFEIIRQEAVQIKAQYFSPSASDKLFMVSFSYRPGKVVSSEFDNPESNSAVEKPISRQDWTIDVQEALSIFAKDEFVNSCLKSSETLMHMSLYRVVSEAPAWELFIVNCPEGDEKGKSYYLNAQTGKMFDLPEQ